MKLLVVGFDGCDHALLKKYIESGNMPFFKDLWDKKKLAVGKLHSQDAVTGISWTNISTGVGKERHGITDGWGRPVDGSKSFATVDVPYIWEMLNRYNMTTGVFSMPCTFPPKMVMGWMVSGFPTPRITAKSELPGVPDKVLTQVAYPPALQKKYLKDYNPDIVQQCCEEKGMSEPGPGEWITYWTGTLNTEVLIRKIQKLNNNNVLALKNLCKEHPVEVMFSQFGFIDRVGHLLGMTGEAEKMAYKEMDRIAAMLIERYRPEYAVIVSDHGFQQFGHTHDGIFLVYSNGKGVYPIDFEAVDVDVVPTILYMLGISQATLLDGKPVYKIFKKSQMSNDDQKEIEDRLRSLGYLE